MISVRIQEKLYIVYMCIVEISRDGCYFHQQNNDRIKAYEDLDFVFVMALKRAVLNGSTKTL